MKISKPVIEVLLDRHPVGHLATLDADKKIHQIPVVFVRHAGIFWSPIDGKPKSAGELARVRNVRNNPNVSLLLDSYEQDWSRLWWIRIEGSANVIQAGVDTDAQITAVVRALCRKYPQYQNISVLREPATLIAISPTRVSNWCVDTSTIVSDNAG